MSGVHQFVPMLHLGDAVGNHTRAVQRLLRGRGVDSEIYVELPDPETTDLTRPAAAYSDDAVPGDVLVYQFATPSSLAARLAARREPLVVNYHNITPPECLESWDNRLARRHLQAQAELAALGRRSALGVAVSEFNRADLVAAGFAHTRVVPPVIGPLGVFPADLAPPRSIPEAPSAGSPEASGSSGGCRWLVVGRLAPNKKVEDAVAALLMHRARHDPGATLVVVGRPALVAYAAALRTYVAELGLEEAVSFVGRVSDQGLARAYRSADVLVAVSEHEGFCLPIVEAMAAGLPVVARRRGAIPEVLGDAGVLLDDPDPKALSDAVAELLGEPGRKDGLVTAGRRQVAGLDLERAGPRLVELLLSVRQGGS